MLPLCLVVSLLMLATSSYQLLLDESATTDEFLDDFLVYPINPLKIRKREVTSQGTHADHDAFVEEKLIQHSQALEQLLRMVTKTSSVTRRLVGHLSRNIEKPSMPEEVKFTRRSSDGKVELVSSITPTAKSPWCELSVLCSRTLKPVCAFDDNFGYGRFYDLCHMFQVNCYWKYNFSIVKNCKPSFDQPSGLV
ncbi:uncharacterized protein LOC134647460 isoform X1 [Cydia amplana]|uniref:uncharacterized protein LOC134647460 isoform X1 n=1 Tax=Cydia amplana TaxID=1869771 RepID=UPI002FE67CF5